MLGWAGVGAELWHCVDGFEVDALDGFGREEVHFGLSPRVVARGWFFDYVSILTGEGDDAEEVVQVMGEFGDGPNILPPRQVFPIREQFLEAAQDGRGGMKFLERGRGVG